MKLLKFYTDTCSQCKQQSRLLEEVDLEGVEVQNIDCEENPELVSKYAVRGLPTIIVIDDQGNEVKRMTGITPPSIVQSIINTVKEGKQWDM